MPYKIVRQGLEHYKKVAPFIFAPRGTNEINHIWGFARSFQFTLSKSTTQADHYVRDAPSGLPSLMEREACLSVDRI